MSTTTPVDAAELQWTAAEWANSAEEAEETYHPHGIVADVTALATGHFWRVTPTARLSEYPELFDAGTEPTREAAKVAAAASVTAALASYADAKGPEHPDMR